MADAFWTRGSGKDDNWGPATPVRANSADEPAPRTTTTLGGRRRRPVGEPAPASLDSDAYAGSPWGPSSSTPTRTPSRPATTPTRPPTSSAPQSTGSPRSKLAALGSKPRRGADVYDDPFGEALPGSATDPRTASQSALARLRAVVPKTNQRGLPGWAALLVQVGVTVVGLLIDALRGVQLGTAFNIGIIAGAVLSILLVRRSSMFPVVVAPPIVYSLGAGISLYFRSGGLSDHSVLIDAATNWLVYGFPAIAAATAAVLIIAGIRLITRR